MPWKETNVYEERMKFIIAWKQGDWTMSDLCREFGISRVTGYKLTLPTNRGHRERPIRFLAQAAIPIFSGAIYPFTERRLLRL